MRDSTLKGRTLLLAAVTMCVAAVAAAGQCVDITAKFTDANFRAWVYGKIGKTAPAPILDCDVSGITVVDVRSKRISDLSGIEYFTAIYLLWCEDNQLTTLDVSKNTALDRLWCSYNELTTLDVSKNIALNGLKCDGNRLTALDVSKNTVLTSLSCGNNQLTALDVSKNTALTSLYCGNNKLTTLDVSKNTALEWLGCDNNQLTALDVSKNTALTELYCYNNQLIALDVSKNTALTKLDCYENNLTMLNVSGATALTELNCYKNQLTTLDVSKNTALKYLYCYNNKLTALNVSGATALTKLICGDRNRSYGNQLTTLDVSKNTALTILDCSLNQLTTLDVSKNTALTGLSCSNNQLTALNVSGATALTELNCYKNQLTTLDVSKNIALTDLNCSDNKLTALDVSKNTVLTSLDCGYNRTVSNSHRNQITTLDVSKNTVLTSLNCSGNELATLDVSKNTELTSLDCYYNNLITLDVTKNTMLGRLIVGMNYFISENDIIGLNKSNLGYYFEFNYQRTIVTFNSQGGSAVSSQTQEVGFHMPKPADPTYDGYHFGGWYRNAACTGNVWNFSYEWVTANLTLYAKWIPKFTVTFNATGGTVTPASDTTRADSTLASSPTPATRSGYIFNGWFTAEIGGENVTISRKYSANTTIYAQWIPLFTITFNTAGGTVTPTSGTTRADSTLASLPTPTRGDDYAFNGWFTAETSGEKITASKKYSANTTIYAQWTQSAYTLTLDPVGGSVTPTIVRIGANGLVVSLPDPTKASNSFDGWFTATTGGERVTEGYTISKDVTIYARWSLISVIFDAVGGTVTPENSTTNPNGTLVSLPTPTKAGNTFNGWFTAATDGEKVTGSTVFTKNSTIYARWTYNAVTEITGIPNAIKVGEQFPLTATVVPENAAKNTILWSIESAGTTDAGVYNGVFLARSEGTVVLKATIADGTAIGVPYEQFFFINAVVSVATPDRVIPSARPAEITSISPVTPLTAEFAAGPNPVSKSSGKVSFFRNGSRVAYATLSIYDASGKVVKKIRVIDDAVGSQTRRKVSSWNLRDDKGRLVSEGTYLVRGVVKTSGGKRERVEVVVGVR